MSKISELSDGGSLQSTDYLIAVRSGGNVKVQADGNLSLGTVTTSGLTVSATTAVVDVLAATNDDATLFLRESGIGVVGAELTYDGGDNQLYLKVGNNSNTKRLSIARDSGDISFYEDTGTTAKFFWDASAEALGIGTSSPSQDIHLYKQNAFLRIQNSDNNYALDLTSNGTVGEIRYSSDLKLMPGGIEAVTLKASGNVGIGTATPGGPLEVTVASGTSGSASGFRLISADGGGYAVYPTSAVANPVWNTNVNSGEQISWSVGGSEKARLDASGNLLVGKTASDTSSAGHELRSGSFAAHTVDGDVALNLRRLNSDGAIARFQKDGTTVGSIKSFSSLVSGIILDPRSSGTGVGATNTDSVIPVNSSGNSDAAKDLGISSARWRNLYLSGGVYLGGTGAANLLDDYEEGTFTPSDNNIGAYTDSYGRYTKIGNVVHCFGYFTVQSNTNGNDADLYMPFAYEFAAQTSTIGTILTNETGNYYLKSVSGNYLRIVDEDEVAQTLADFSTKTVHFNVTFHTA